eukprot:4961427-Prymnesium_polylepis.1
MPVNASDRQVNASECVCGGKRAAGVVGAVDAVGAEAKRGRGMHVRGRARRDGAQRGRRRAALARGGDLDRGRRCQPTLGHDIMDAGGGGDSRQPAEAQR